MNSDGLASSSQHPVTLGINQSVGNPVGKEAEKDEAPRYFLKRSGVARPVPPQNISNIYG